MGFPSPSHKTISILSFEIAAILQMAPGLNVSRIRTSSISTSLAKETSNHSGPASGLRGAQAEGRSPASIVSGAPVACSGPHFRLGWTSASALAIKKKPQIPKDVRFFLGIAFCVKRGAFRE